MKESQDALPGKRKRHAGSVRPVWGMDRGGIGNGRKKTGEK